MSTSPTNDLLTQALALPEDDRIRLAGDLLASVTPPGGLSVDDDDFEDMLARRRQELRDGTVKTYTIDETIAAMRDAVAKRSQA